MNGKPTNFLSSGKVKLFAASTVLALIAGVIKQLTDSDSGTNPDWNVVIPGILNGLGLFFARQNNVSSEEAGIK